MRIFPLNTRPKSIDVKPVVSEEFFCLLSGVASGIDDAFLCCNRGGVIYANRRAEELFALSASELIATNIDALFVSEFNLTLPELFARGASLDGRKVAVRRSKALTIPAILRTWIVEHETESYLMASVRDISEKQRVEDLIRMLSTAVEQSASTVVITGKDGVIEYVNPKFTQLTGYSLEEAVGCTPSMLKSGHTPPEKYHDLWNTIREGHAWRGELQNKKKNGELYWESITISPIINNGSITHFLAVEEDITERIEAEAKRKEAEHHLRRAQKLESLGEIAAGIAHDFNNILTGIIGQADLALIELPPDAPVRNRLKQLETSAQRAAELVRKILAFAGKTDFVFEPLDVSELVGTTWDLIKQSVAKDVNFTFTLPTDLPSIHADIGQIQQVVINLIHNAVEAVSPGEGVVAVTTGSMWASEQYLAESILGQGGAEGDYVFIEVSDNGCGIDEETLNRIFDPFFSTKFLGRGLGLAAVQGITKGHHGVIRVATSPEKGCIMRLLFPAQYPFN